MTIDEFNEFRCSSMNTNTCYVGYLTKTSSDPAHILFGNQIFAA